MKKLDYIAYSIILIYLLPFLIFGQDIFFRINDGLDCENSMFKILAESGKNGALDTPIDNIMNGVTRLSYQSNLNFYRLLYYIDPYFALVFNKILSVLVGFLSMKLFLSKYILKEKDDFILYGISLCFAFLPNWDSTSMSIATLPFIFYVFFNIYYGKEKKTDWLILLILPFFTDFIRVELFVIIVFSMFFVFQSFVKKKINLKWFFALGLYLLVFLIIEYRLVFYIIDKPFISHRVEFGTFDLNFIEFIKKTLYHLVFDQSHIKNVQAFFILPSFLICFYIMIKNKNIDKQIVSIFSTIVLFTIIFKIYYWSPFEKIYNSNYNPFRTIQMNRFYWLNPLLWYTLFAQSIFFLTRYFRNKKLKNIFYSFMLCQIILLFFNADHFRGVFKNNDSFISYGQFFSEDLFSKIRSDIPEDIHSFKTLSVGIHPSIAQYNQFYTLDGYLGNYPLSYKKEFRKIISKELKKSDEIRILFDEWGSKCYLFSSEIGEKMFENNVKILPKSINLDIDTEQIKKMGGLYLFSTSKINNSKKLNLQFIKNYTDRNSPWIIYLYRVT